MPPASSLGRRRLRDVCCALALNWEESHAPRLGNSNSSAVHNFLLAALLPPISLYCDRTTTTGTSLKKDIERPNRRIEFVCFVKTASRWSWQSNPRRECEVGLIGRDGMTGTAVVRGGRRQWTPGGSHARFAREAELPQAARRAKRDWFQTTKQVAS